MVKKVSWNAENDRKLLLQLMPRDTKEVNMQALAGMYDGATPKAIEERIAKLKREKKATDAATLVSASSPSSSTPTVQSKPRKPATKSPTTGDDIGIGPAASPGGRKRGRAPTKTEERARKKGEIFGVGDDEEMEGIKKEEHEEGGEGEGGVKGEMVEDEISDVDDEGKGKATKRAKVDATDPDGKDTDAKKGKGKATADIEDEPEEMVYVIAEDEDGKVGFKVEAKKEGKTKVEEGK